MTGLRCPRCGFAFSPRASFLMVEHCPRCLGRARVAVPLERVSSPAARPTALPLPDEKTVPRRMRTPELG
jgi:hypothetical protein